MRPGWSAREKAGWSAREKTGWSAREKTGWSAREKAGEAAREKAGWSARERAGEAARGGAGGRGVVGAGVGAGLLAGSWWALSRKSCQRLDVRLGEGLRRVGSPGLDRFVATTTDLGSLYAVSGAAATLAVLGRRRTAADVLAVGLVAWAVAQATKTGVGRVRPYDAEGVRRLVDIPTGSSFPSGHAAVGVAVSTVLVAHARPSTARVVLGLVGVYVPVTRVHVGVHYPTDVLGGAGMGLVLGSLWRGPLAATGRGALRAGLALTRRLGSAGRARPAGPAATRRGRGRGPRS